MKRSSLQPALPIPSSAAPHNGLLQRKCGCNGSGGGCQECDKKKIQRKPANGETQESSAPPIVNSVLNSPGQPLGGETRAMMESYLGHDFGQVRIHVDGQAADSARSVNALAYTVGSDVVFRESQYSPHTTAGQRLLLHELTHVVQQRSQSPTSTSATTLEDNPALEQEADRVANAALSGQPATAFSSVPTNVTQRMQRQQAAKTDAPTTQSTNPATAKTANAPAGCVQTVAGEEPESLTRMDTVTVIEVCGGASAACDSAKADLGALCSEIQAKPKRVKFRVFYVDSDLKENENMVGRFGKGPQTLVYKERTRKLSLTGYTKPNDYLDQIRGVYQESLSEGAFKGIEIGAAVGGVVGGIVGSAVGGVLGGLGGAIGGGLLGGATGAGLGILIGWAIGAATAKDIGAAHISEKRRKEVADYLEELARTDKIAGGLGGDDLARDAVELWVENKAKLNLSPQILKLLVLEMLDGTVSRADQRAILKILENASDLELLQIFSVKEPPRLLDLEGVFSGEEKTYLKELLEQMRKRFPVLAPTANTIGLMIDNPVVKASLAAAFNDTHQPKPGEVRRECCGAFIENVKTKNVYPEPTPATCTVSTPTEQAECPTNELARTGLEKHGMDHRIAASFHTHPLVAPPQARMAPSPADFKPGFQGPEHYVVDPFNVNLIQFENGKAVGFRILGSTSALLGVKRIEPSNQRSTLELG